MNIAIIGGGISGLYCGNLLTELGHNITIYENNKFGGCIDYITYNNKDYPLSAFIIFLNNYNCTKFIKELNMKVASKECFYNYNNTFFSYSLCY